MQAHKHTITMLVTTAILCAGVTLAKADVVVISHKDSPTKSLTARQVANIFLGKTSKLPDGTRVELKDQTVDSPVRGEFYHEVVHKTEHQLRAYWAKRIFAGKGSAPKPLASDAAVVKWVSAKPGRVGYVSADTPVENLTVLLRTTAKP